MQEKKKNLLKCEENFMFSGIVNHERIKPFRHSFKYHLTYFWFDINLTNRYRLLKKNKFSFFSFYDSDHGPVKPKIKCLFEYFKGKLDLKKKDIKKIKALCLPRTFGYVFNPISVFLIYNNDNLPVRIIFEVSNTFGERHAYVCKTNKKGIYHLNKMLYVSPFFKTKGKYEIHFNIKKKFVNLFILYEINNVKVFKASFIGKSMKMTEFNFLKIFFNNMFQNFKVTFGIYAQALKLWLKGATYIKKPNKPENFITKL
ncbi:MAG: hypothetical protein CL572_00390 [Alphaproteobacteria bacterium]|nr:hypothetical protein [Alphaproteobacteria bacterium]